MENKPNIVNLDTHVNTTGEEENTVNKNIDN